MVTIAPELPGALDAIRLLVERGVVAAIGHTDATYEQTLAGVDGRRDRRHPRLQRDAAGAPPRAGPDRGAARRARAWSASRSPTASTCTTACCATRSAPPAPDRVALITDAIAAAGMPDGAYELGGQAVRWPAGWPGSTGDGAIAGSTLTMDAALRRAVHSGVSIVDAARMAAAHAGPGARAAPTSSGRSRRGLRADLVLLDDELRVIGVLRGRCAVPGITVGCSAWLACPR